MNLRVRIIKGNREKEMGGMGKEMRRKRKALILDRG